MSCIVVVGLVWIYPSLCQLILSVTPQRGNTAFWWADGLGIKGVGGLGDENSRRRLL